jgi:hypothetical protein
VLERTPCFGTCAAYRLRVTRSGVVTFLSRNRGDSSRVARDSIAPDAVVQLLQAAERDDVFRLPAVIADDRALCPDRATDHPVNSSATDHRLSWLFSEERPFHRGAPRRAPAAREGDRQRLRLGAVDSGKPVSRSVSEQRRDVFRLRAASREFEAVNERSWSSYRMW